VPFFGGWGEKVVFHGGKTYRGHEKIGRGGGKTRQRPPVRTTTGVGTMFGVERN